MKFSIIVPVYNVEEYLDKCLSSIFNNSYKNYEVIIINDGTKDNSEKIIDKYLKKYKNITYIKQTNKGLSIARNEGIKKVTGDYILFIDGDDYIEEDMFDILNKNLDDKPDLLRYQLREVYNDRIVDVIEDGFDIVDGIEGFRRITRYKYIEASTLYAYKTTFFKQNKFKFKPGIYHEDFALIPIIISKAKTIKSISYIGYNYIQREESIMNNYDHEKMVKKMDDTISSYEEAIKTLNKINNSSVVKHFYSNSLLQKYNSLDKLDKMKYKQKLRDLGVFNYLKCDTIKRKIKKVIYKIKFEVEL